MERSNTVYGWRAGGDSNGGRMVDDSVSECS